MAFRFREGTVWAGFKIEAELGEGRVGDTFRARRVSDGALVALKVANPLRSASRDFVAAFQRQSRILQQVKHAGIVPVVDAGVHEGVPYCAFTYIAGPREDQPCTLRQYIAERVERERPIDDEEAAVILLQLCAALEALHAIRSEDCPAGLALGDLRPENVLIDAETAIRLSDAGFGVVAEAGQRAMIGAARPVRNPVDLDYMSPEYRDGQPADARADVYSLGAIAYELLTGRRVEGAATPPSKLRADLNPAWDALILEKALSFQPDQRFESVRAFRKAVEKILPVGDQPAKRVITIPSAGGNPGRTVLTIKPAHKPPPTVPPMKITVPAAKPAVPMPEAKPPAPQKPAPPPPASAGPKSITIPGKAGKPATKTPPPAPQPAPEPEPEKAADAPAAGSKRGLWIALAAGAVLLAGGGTFAAIHFSRSKTPAKLAATAKAAGPVSAAAATSTPVAAAASNDVKPIVIADLGMKLIWIPPGRALLGSTDEERQAVRQLLGSAKTDFLTNEVVREARLAKGFWLSETEVTVAQWRKFVADRPAFKSEAEERGSAYGVTEAGVTQVVKGITWKTGAGGKDAADAHPVVLVGATDAEAFCQWLTERERAAARIHDEYSFRLPKSAEWEYAARGGAARRDAYWWGTKLEAGEGRFNGAGAEFAAIAPASKGTCLPWTDPQTFTAPAGSFGDKGRNGYGLQDMYGNVAELCYNGTNRPVLRGGSFMDGADWCRSAAVRMTYPHRPNAFTGFRVALAATPGK